MCIILVWFKDQTLIIIIPLLSLMVCCSPSFCHSESPCLHPLWLCLYTYHDVHCGFAAITKTKSCDIERPPFAMFRQLSTRLTITRATGKMPDDLYLGHRFPNVSRRWFQRSIGPFGEGLGRRAIHNGWLRQGNARDGF